MEPSAVAPSSYQSSLCPLLIVHIFWRVILNVDLLIPHCGQIPHVLLLQWRLWHKSQQQDEIADVMSSKDANPPSSKHPSYSSTPSPSSPSPKAPFMDLPKYHSRLHQQSPWCRLQGKVADVLPENCWNKVERSCRGVSLASGGSGVCSGGNSKNEAPIESKFKLDRQKWSNCCGGLLNLLHYWRDKWVTLCNNGNETTMTTAWQRRRSSQGSGQGVGKGFMRRACWCTLSTLSQAQHLDLRHKNHSRNHQNNYNNFNHKNHEDNYCPPTPPPAPLCAHLDCHEIHPIGENPHPHCASHKGLLPSVQ